MNSEGKDYIIVATGRENGGWEYIVNKREWNSLALNEQTDRIVERAIEERLRYYKALVKSRREQFLETMLSGVSNERIKGLIHQVWEHIPETERVFLEQMSVRSVETKEADIVSQYGKPLRAAARVISERDNRYFSKGGFLYLNVDRYSEDDWIWRYSIAHEFVHLAYRHNIIVEFALGPEATYAKDGRGISLLDACEAHAKNQAGYWLELWVEAEKPNL
jgi:hypothetical protein